MFKLVSEDRQRKSAVLQTVMAVPYAAFSVIHFLQIGVFRDSNASCSRFCKIKFSEFSEHHMILVVNLLCC